MDKRGGVYDFINSQTFWMMVIPFVIILVFSIAFLSEMMTSDILYTDDSMKIEFSQDRLFSAACFALYDHELLRSYPYVIDVSRFNQETLDSCMDSDIGFRLELEWLGSPVMAIKTDNFDSFDLVRTRDVIVYDGMLHKGQMRIMIDRETD